MEEKRDIKSLDHGELELLVQELGQPRYRVRQIEEWLYVRGCSIISEMDNIPKSLRADLERRFFVGTPSLVVHQVSEDGTRKYLFSLHDDVCVEAVGIPSNDGRRLTVCFSSQAGCPMGCIFCATGLAGFTRNLTSGEMYDQVRLVGEDFGMRVTNAVCMGQGEPFLNYDSVLTAIRRMNSSEGLGIGARHITVSTCGVPEGIRRFGKEPEQFTLAISLHSAVQDRRNLLMPGIARVSLDELRDIVRQYANETGRRPTFEYACIRGLNDDDESIAALVGFCEALLCHVNLIPLNPIGEGEDGAGMVEPSNRIEHISRCLTNRGIENSIRVSRGKDIDGACGQLRQRSMNHISEQG